MWIVIVNIDQFDYKRMELIKKWTDPDFDAGAGSSAQPVAVGAEAESIDGITTTVQGVQVLAFIEVPEHGLSVLTTRRTEWTIRGDCHRVQVPAVPVVVGLQLAVGQIPNLKDKLPKLTCPFWTFVLNIHIYCIRMLVPVLNLIISGLNNIAN